MALIKRIKEKLKKINQKLAKKAKPAPSKKAVAKELPKQVLGAQQIRVISLDREHGIAALDVLQFRGDLPQDRHPLDVGRVAVFVARGHVRSGVEAGEQGRERASSDR